MYIINKLTLGLPNLGSNVMSKIIGNIVKPTAYTNERISDNFATYYGYGPELTSALGKMSTTDSGLEAKDYLNNVPIISNIINILSMPAEIAISAFDEHPEYLERLQDKIRMLKRELKKGDIDPKMKEEIEIQITQIEDSKEKFINKRRYT